MDRALPTLDVAASLDEAFALLSGGDASAVIATRGGRPVGVVTKLDVLEYLAHHATDPARTLSAPSERPGRASRDAEPANRLGRPFGPECRAPLRESPVRRPARQAQDRGRLAQRVSLGQQSKDGARLRRDRRGLVRRADPMIDRTEASQVVDESIDHVAGGGRVDDQALAAEGRQQRLLGTLRVGDGTLAHSAPRTGGGGEPGGDRATL